MDQGSASSAAATANALIGPITTAHLIMIALLAIVVVIVVVLAARVRARAARERRNAGDASERLNEIGDVVPPTAPPPPPMADTPVVATAPLDAAPATLAGDMEPVRDAPEADAADDLTQLKGVGPKLAAQLATLGITRFAQIAALSPAEATALDARLGAFAGRLTRDRWIEQAGYLARGDRAGFEGVFGKL